MEQLHREAYLLKKDQVINLDFMGSKRLRLKGSCLFRWDKNSKFTAFLLLLRQALWTLKHMGIHSVFALSTSKELGKLIEDRQIQDGVSAGILCPLHYAKMT
jgi:hypothetical protein